MVEVVREGRGGHVEVALHVELSAGGRRFGGALVGERLDALKRGEEVGEESEEERMVGLGPVGRGGEGG